MLRGLGSIATAAYGAGCTYVVVARTAGLADADVLIVDYNRASTFFPEEVIWETIDPYYNAPVVLGHALSLWTRPHPASTRSWRSRRARTWLRSPSG